MSAHDLFKFLVCIHILTGATGLISFWVPIAVRKGSADHRRWGRVFTAMMVITGLVAVGIVTMLATQALINAAMTVGLMPITGITLPLASYGGSSLVSTCAAVGLLMNIAMRPGYEVAGGQTWE